MDTYDRIIHYLDAHQAVYELLSHQKVASALEYHTILKTAYSQQAKALFVRYTDNNDTKGYFVISLPGDKKADFDEIKQTLHLKDIRMAYENELTRYTGCIFGQLPPLGKLFGYKLLFSRSFLHEEKIYFNVGRHDRSICIDPQVLIQLEDPILL